MIKVKFGYQTPYWTTINWKDKIRKFKNEENLFKYIDRFNSLNTKIYQPNWIIVDFKIIQQ